MTNGYKYTKSYSINDKIYEKFIEKTQKLNQMNRSAVIENLIDNYNHEIEITLLLENGASLAFTIHENDFINFDNFLNKLIKKKLIKSVRI